MQSPDKPRVILHIGGSKCGSSAIQAFLAKNAEALADRSVGVPGQKLDFESTVTGEQIWFLEDAAAAGQHELIRDRVIALTSQAKKRGLSTIVISAENICNHPDLAEVMTSALEGADVQIIFYVRRQDDFLISSWQQWNLKRFDRVEDFLKERVGQDACWFDMIVPWADAFGDARVSVRPFLRERLTKGDVIRDFFACANLSPDGLEPLSKNANPSFDEALARLAHRVRDVFDGPHDNRFYAAMVRLIGEDALKKGSASSLLSLEVRRLILASYEQQNVALKRRFLPELGDAPLFPEPIADDVIVKSEAEKLNDEIAMLTRAVYALAERADPEAK